MSLDNDRALQQHKLDFKEAFPNYLNESIVNLDPKHHTILKKINSSDWLAEISVKTIRTWNSQDDLGAPLNFKFFIHSKLSILEKFKRLEYLLIRNRSLNKQLLGTAKDDLAIIEQKGGFDLLRKNPVNKTPGFPIFAYHKNVSYNLRWLRYIYLATQIQIHKLLPSNAIWLDIGSYYGGLQAIIANEIKVGKIILVDFHHQIFRSYVFLKSLFPNAIHDLGGLTVNKNTTNLLSFHYVHVSKFNVLEEMNLDLVTNFFSMGEMSRSDFNGYLTSQTLNKSANLYMVNRFVSSPFFEPTYKNDLNIFDYKFSGHNLKYFDVFPIHHYFSIPRNLLGSKRPRNISSPYFEALWSNPNFKD